VILMQLLAVATLAVSLSDSDAAVSGGDVGLPAVPGSRAAGGGGVAEAVPDAVAPVPAASL